jgi:hypothetical protein
MLEGAFFLDCGTDLGSGHQVPGELPFFHSVSKYELLADFPSLRIVNTLP